MNRLRTVIALLAAAGIGVLVAPGAAQAASVGVASTVGTTVEYRAASGKANRVVIQFDVNAFVIDDRFPIKAGKGCSAVPGDRTKVRCATTRPTQRIRVHTYDRNDTIRNRTIIRLIAWAGSGNDTVYGGGHGDYLYGEAGADKLYGGGDHDRISGGSGNDVADGGIGDDTISGDSGNDTISGNVGNDHLTGFTGRDRAYGGAGNDHIDMHTTAVTGDDDYVSGGAGRDYVSYMSYRKPITADADGVRGDDGAKGERDTIATDVEALRGGEASDRLSGTSRADTLEGWLGDDVIHGGDGDDVLQGGDGRDRLYGNDGDDVLDGAEWDHSLSTDPDVLNGGADGTALGDRCIAYTGDVKQFCER